MDKKNKKIVLDLLKSIDIQEWAATEDKKKQKWFRFGAYDALRTASQLIQDLPEPAKKKIEVKDK